MCTYFPNGSYRLVSDEDYQVSDSSLGVSLSSNTTEMKELKNMSPEGNFYLSLVGFYSDHFFSQQDNNGKSSLKQTQKIHGLLKKTT